MLTVFFIILNVNNSIFKYILEKVYFKQKKPNSSAANIKPLISPQERESKKQNSIGAANMKKATSVINTPIVFRLKKSLIALKVSNKRQKTVPIKTPNKTVKT